MVAVRLRQLEHDLGEMLNEVHDVRGDHELLVLSMSQFLSVCQEGDLYLTASLPQLWHDENIGVRGRYLAVNKDVIKRKTTLRRVFLVTKRDVQNESTLDVLRAHAEMLDEIEEELAERPMNTRESPIEQGGVFTGVRLIDVSDRDKLLSRLEHSGIWIRGESAKLLLPTYDDGGYRLSGIRLLPAGAASRTLIHQFEKDHLHQAQEIRTFLSERS